jgi:hypothetical protein
VLEPVGPLPARVYWLRRLAVLGIILAVVGLLGWIFLGRGGSAGASTTTLGASSAPTTVSTLRLTGELAIPTTTAVPPFAITTDTAGTTAVVGPAEGAGAVTGTGEPSPSENAAAASAASVAAESAASTAAAESAKSAASAASVAAASEAAAAAAASEAAAASAAAASAAARQTDAEGRLICPDGALTLTATVGAPTYRVGEQPIVGVTVRNTGSEACVRDVSGSLQEYLAYDGAGNRVWSTNDCAPGTGTDVRMLEPGQSVQYNIRWSGKSSQPGCAVERVRVGAGTYAIEARIGALVSSRQQLEFR